MKNIDLVKTTIQILKEVNVSEVIICAGARNIPFIDALEKSNLVISSYFEERSAGFYALGRSRRLKQPVAVLTTSGTAVAELLPSVIEAYYQNIPIVMITADRPKAYRGTGAPQAIEQKNIFQNYVESTFDWDVYNTNFDFEFSGKMPLHFNICFDEPLIDGQFHEAVSVPFNICKRQKENFQTLNECAVNPLVIISEINPQDRESVISFLKKNSLFHYAEFQSELRHHPEIHNLQINTLDSFSEIENKYHFKSIIRIGGIPTHRIWRDLESKYKNIPVYSFSSRHFSGLSRASSINEISSLSDLKIMTDEHFNQKIISERNQESEKILNNLTVQCQNSEPSFLKELSQTIGDDAIYIGNSLPIREWDLVSLQNKSNSNIKRESSKKFANRGANGIDGQISTYLGWSKDEVNSWCLIGDLTALYDLAALGLSEDQQVSRIIVINNSGGKIFNRILGQTKYLNAQEVDFSGWAKMWNWDFLKIDNVSNLPVLKTLKSKKIIIEIVPNNEQSDLFWKEWDRFCLK